MKNKKCKRFKKRIINNIFLLFIIITMIAIFTNVEFGKKEIITNEIVVQGEDTLWGIAQRICKKNPTLNLQNIIYEIREINNLPSSNIYIGQTLKIPIY